MCVHTHRRTHAGLNHEEDAMSQPGDLITRTPIVSKVIYNLKQMPNNVCDRVMATQRYQDPSI